MSHKPVKLIVAGCGRVVTEVHLPNLNNMQSVQVVGLVDPDRDSLDKAALLAPDADVFADLEEALAKAPCDAVLIASPSGLHAPMASMALEEGRHVYLEKPVATDLEGARRLAAHPFANRVMVGFNYRFHPLVREMRKLVRTGGVGDAVCVRTLFSTPDANAPAWKRQRAQGGGALLDLTTHDVDMIRYVTGREIITVSALITSRHAEGDSALLLLECEDGMTAQCVALSGCAESAQFDVTGEKGGASFERYRSSRVKVWGRRAGGLRERVRSVVREAAATPERMKRMRHPWNDPSFGLALDSFVKSVKSSKPPRVTLEEGLRSLSVLLAAEESMRTGSRVPVKNFAIHQES
jgi:UDP-N-acetylglucosamine 3-dehydrogenase